MKKITVLLILFLSLNTLNGMEINPEPEKSFPLGELLTETKEVIVQAICSYDNLDTITETIDATKLINREFNSIVKNVYGNYNNIKEFTTLVHLLSDKFPEATTETIAKKLKIPIAQKYVELGNKLLHLSGTFFTNTTTPVYAELKELFHVSGTVFTNTFDASNQIIKDEADVNFTTSFIVDHATGAYHTHTPLFFALEMRNWALVKLLNDSGIKEKTWRTVHATLEKIQKAREARGLR